MSNDPFFHKNTTVSFAMRATLAIMRRDFASGMDADGINAAANKLADRFRRPSQLGRTTERRHRVLKTAINVAVSRGHLRFTDNRLAITDRGQRLLEDRSRRRDRRYGRSTAMAA